MTTDKTPATLAVDVLAVLRSQLSWIGPCRPDGDEINCERWDRIELAIAATADLIEAAGKLRADVFLWRLTGNMPNLQMLANDEEALDAALSRVKGESA